MKWFDIEDVPYESTLSNVIFFGRGSIGRLAHVRFGGNPTHSSLRFVDDVTILGWHLY